MELLELYNILRRFAMEKTLKTHVDRLITKVIKSKRPHRLSAVIRLGMLSEYLANNGSTKTAEFQKLYNEVVKEFSREAV